MTLLCTPVVNLDSTRCGIHQQTNNYNHSRSTVREVKLEAMAFYQSPSAMNFAPDAKSEQYTVAMSLLQSHFIHSFDEYKFLVFPVILEGHKLAILGRDKHLDTMGRGFLACRGSISPVKCPASLDCSTSFFRP